MSNTAPTKIAIDHDDYAAKHVGRTKDGKQFFLTTPFVPAIDTEGKEFIALYIFDSDGNLLDAKVNNLGPRATMNIQAARKCIEDWLTDLGEKTLCRIEVRPFEIERFGEKMGLIAKKFEGTWSVSAQPGDYMAFYEPWDSGYYDT